MDSDMPVMPWATVDETEHALAFWEQLRRYAMVKLKDCDFDIVNDLSVGINPNTATLEELLTYGARVYQLKKILEGYTEVLDSNFNTVALKGGEMMRDKNVDSMVIKDDDGHKLANVKFDLVFAPSIKDKPRAFAWLRENGLGEIIEESVHPQRLKSSLKKKLYGLSDEEVSDEADTGDVVAFPDEEIIAIWQQPRFKITKLHQ